VEEPTCGIGRPRAHLTRRPPRVRCRLSDFRPPKVSDLRPPLTEARLSRRTLFLSAWESRCAQRLGLADPRSPFYDPHPSDVRVGADLKYLLTSSFTLSATVNPDVGQVEVDPAVVNLSAYETFFPEQRPFFVEGADVFAFGNPGCNLNCGMGLALLYSRRIGRPPQGEGLAFAQGPFADVPQNSTILGAAKITGRSRSGFIVGLIDAVTRREVAEVALDDTGRVFQPVEPLTNSFVGRVKREFQGGRVVLGGIVRSNHLNYWLVRQRAALDRSVRKVGRGALKLGFCLRWWDAARVLIK